MRSDDDASLILVIARLRALKNSYSHIRQHVVEGQEDDEYGAGSTL